MNSMVYLHMETLHATTTIAGLVYWRYSCHVRLQDSRIYQFAVWIGSGPIPTIASESPVVRRDARCCVNLLSYARLMLLRLLVAAYFVFRMALRPTDRRPTERGPNSVMRPPELGLKTSKTPLGRYGDLWSHITMPGRERYGIWSTGVCVTEFGPRSVGLRSVGPIVSSHSLSSFVLVLRLVGPHHCRQRAIWLQPFAFRTSLAVLRAAPLTVSQ